MNDWNPCLDSQLTDYVFDSNISNNEIAVFLGVKEKDVRERIRYLGLSWVRRRDGHVSRGQGALASVMRKLIPGEKIVTEEPIGNRLRLDVYCPRYKLAIEYHGRQHFQYVEHFHGNIQGFYDSQMRDEKKEKICQDLGITLVVFRYNDLLDENSVFERLLDGLSAANVIEDDGSVEVDTSKYKKKKIRIKDHPGYEAYQARQREYRRETYRRMKRNGRT